MATGVYIILNKKTDKGYVGSAASSLADRWEHHRSCLRTGKHHNSYLQASWNKHGEESFEFVILEHCQPSECLKREQHWIDSRKSAERKFGYNLSPTAGSPFGVKRSAASRARMSAARIGKDYLSPEARAKAIAILTSPETVAKSMEARQRPECKAKQSAAKLGKPLSEQHRAKLSAVHKGKSISDDQKKSISATLLGHAVSEETRAKLAKANRGMVITAEHRAKLSAALKGRKQTPDEIARRTAPLIGRKLSEKHRESLRRGWLKRKARMATV